jgi:hypothetical protein
MLLIACSILLCLPAISQITFDSSIPSNWSTTGATPLSLSAEHYKGSSHSLKWQAAAGDTLQAVSLGIPASAISSSSHWYMYSAAAANDTVVIQFLDAAGTVRREGHLLLNFTGWREYHRNLKDDYNYGSTLPLFAPDQFRMIYKPSGGGSRAIYVDEVLFTGFGEARIPGPHMRLDYQHFARNPDDGPAGNALASWLNVPDIAATTPVTAELTGLSLVKTAYTRALPAVAATAVDSAKAYVASFNITRNADNSIVGRPIDSITIYYPDKLKLISKHCGVLARAWYNNSDAAAYNNLQLFTEFLLDQGLAEGGRNVILTNDYKTCDTFSLGFLQAIQVLPSNLRSGVMGMLKWSNEYNKIYAASVTPGLNMDYLYKKTPFLLELACSFAADSNAVRDLKSISRFLEQNTYTSQGGRDGIKPDGTGFHHQVHYVTYMHAFQTWITDAYALRQTPFKVSTVAYNNMSNAMKALFLETNYGLSFANAECGRNPFDPSLLVDTSYFRKLVQIGGDVLGTTIDTSLAAAGNYLCNTSNFSVPAAGMDGFYQFNYAQMGVYRRNNYAVVMKGLTNKLFGTEIYAAENRYGRYQSYGAMEVLYDGKYSSTGYLKDGVGWDWNVVPGATTVHFPTFTGLQCGDTTAEEHQQKSFAGALSLGKDGIWAMDFLQDTVSRNYTGSNLAFHKSVFAFDTIMVCLGSGIRTTNSLGNVATNLFQAIYDSTKSNATIYINSSAGSATDTSITIAPGKYIFTAQKTYFYIPTGNDSIKIVRGAQYTPAQSSTNGTPVLKSQASKAWLSHGTSPVNAGYHYVVIPNSSKSVMGSLGGTLSGGTVYTVLKKTDSLHAVKYIPGNLTGYVFFQPAGNVNIGYVKSISGKALVGIRESGDTVKVNIACPDLNTIADSTSYWTSASVPVVLTLAGNFTVGSDPTGAYTSSNTDSLTATFNLVHGLPASLVLIKHSGSRRKGADSTITKQAAGMQAAAALNIVPNPAGGHAQLVYASPVAERVEVSVVSPGGQVLLRRYVQVGAGVNAIPVSVTGLANGVYTITVKGSPGVQEKRLVKY